MSSNISGNKRIAALPLSVRVVRILLYTVGGLTLMTSLSAWLGIGGGYGLGVGIVFLVPATASLLAARRVADPRRLTWVWLGCLQVVYILWQLSRIPSSDPFALAGIAFPVVILVLCARPAARRHFRRVGSRTKPLLKLRALRAYGDRGESAISYIATVLLIAAVVVGLISTALPAQVSGYIEKGVCTVSDDRDCTPAKSANAGGTNGTGGAAAPSVPRRHGGDGGSDDDDYYEKCWVAAYCELTDGLRNGFGNAGKGLWDGAKFLVCLVPWCDSTGDNWKGIGNLFTNPLDSAKSIWDESTKQIRDDWNNGHKWRAAGMALPTIFGTIFGGKGLGKLKLLGDGKIKAIPDLNSFIKLIEKIDDQIDLGSDAALRGDLDAAEDYLRSAEEQLRQAHEAGSDFPDDAPRAGNSQFYLNRLKSEILLRRALLETPGGQYATNLLIKHGIRLDAIHDRDRYVTFNKNGAGFDHPTLDIHNNHGHNGPLTEEQARLLAPHIVRELQRARFNREFPDQQLWAQ